MFSFVQVHAFHGSLNWHLGIVSVAPGVSEIIWKSEALSLGIVVPEYCVLVKVITTFEGAVQGKPMQSVGLFHSSGGS